MIATFFLKSLFPGSLWHNEYSILTTIAFFSLPFTHQYLLDSYYRTVIALKVRDSKKKKTKFLALGSFFSSVIHQIFTEKPGTMPGAGFWKQIKSLLSVSSQLTGKLLFCVPNLHYILLESKIQVYYLPESQKVFYPQQVSNTCEEKRTKTLLGLETEYFSSYMRHWERNYFLRKATQWNEKKVSNAEFHKLVFES